MQAKLELQQTLLRKIEEILPKDGHVDIDSIDPQESENNAYRNLLALRRIMREFMGLGYEADFIQDLKQLTNSKNIKKFVERLIAERLITSDTQSINALLDDLEQGQLADVLKFTTDRAKESLFGALGQVDQDLSDRSQSLLYQELGTFFGRPDLNKPNFSNSRVNSVMAMLSREFGTTARRGFGLVTGATAGQAVLYNILSAQKSIDISMFQLEHSLLLGALYFKQQQFKALNTNSGLGAQLNVMVSPPKAYFDQDGNPILSDELEPGFNWINQAARSLLGSAVKFDPDVEAQKAKYAHQKFIATDLDNTVKARVIVGSFNLTRGALGNILDRSGHISRRNPNNFELGFNIGFDLVKYAGLRLSSFKQIIQEARDYRSWLFGRTDPTQTRGDLKDPKYLLTGPETYTKIQKSLGLGTTPENIQSKVDAFFMLNVITDRGLLDIRNKQGLYHTIDEKLRASSDSKITIFVSSGFKNIRSRDLGPEDSETSQALKMLHKLETDFEGRFRIVEVDQLIHAKGAFIFKGSGGLDIIAGSTNVSGTAMGGDSLELSMGLSTDDFKDGSWLKTQATNVLNYLWTVAARPSKINPISNLSHASAERIRFELTQRLNPALTRLVKVQPLFETLSGGSKKVIGSRITLNLETGLKDSTRFRQENIFSFDVLEYGGDPSRLYLPQLQKIIDPVLAQSAQDQVQLGTEGTRGNLTAIEFGPAAVIAAATEHVIFQMGGAASEILNRYSGRTTRGSLYLRNELKRVASQSVRQVFKHFEGKPVGEFASDARKFQRLVYGLSMRDNMADAHFDLIKLAQVYAKTLTPTAIPVLVLDDRARPNLDPVGVERSFEYMLNQLEQGFQIGDKKSVANAPNEVIRMAQNGVDVKPLLFTVLAKGLMHDRPTKLLLAEGFKYISATDYDEESQSIQFFLNPAKLDQLTQRFKNAIGADVNFLETVSGSRAENSLKTVVMPIGSSGDKDRVRKGTRFNMLIMWGLNEQAMVQADLFRGALTGHSIPMSFEVDPRNLINSADLETFNMFDGKVKFDINGNLVVFDPTTGEYRKHEPGQSLLEIGAEQKHIHAFTFWNGHSQQISTMSNPIYGHRGAKIRINGIEKVTDPSGTFKFMVNADMLVPVGGNMRALSQNLKMVFTGMGSFVDPLTKKVRSVFTDVADAINAAVKGNKNEDLVIHGFSVGKLGDVYANTFKALGMTSDQQNASRELSVNKLHGLVGESIIKSGVALLHTGYALLSGEFDGGAWSDNFLSIFTDKTRAKQFDTMLSRLQQDVADAIKIDQTNVSDLKQLFLLQGLDALLTGQGTLEKSLKEHLLEARSEKFKQTINAIRSGKLTVVTEIGDRVVLAAAAAYHAASMVEGGKKLRKETIGMSQTIGGRSLGSGTLDPERKLPNIMWDTPIPISFVENLSVALPMSGRESSIFHTNYFSPHSQTMLSSLRMNPEVENRSKLVGELLAVGYIGGTALTVAHNAVKRINVGKGNKQVNLSVTARENLLVAGVHFEPLSYTFAGMNEKAQMSLLAMSDLVRSVTYGHVENGVQRDLTPTELEAVKREYAGHVENLKASMSAGTTVNMRTSPQVQEHQIQALKLMSQAKLSGPVMKVPVFVFRDYNEHTHELVSLDYEQMSLPSPDAAFKLQTFDNHTGEILKLYHEVLSQNLAVRNVIKQAQMFGGIISSQVREQYENWYSKVQQLQVKIREAGTTDIQKTMAAMTGVQGFSMIANTIGGLDNLIFKENQNIVDSDGNTQKLTFENVIVVGDEVLMTVVSEAMVALKLARKHAKNYLKAKSINVAETGPTLDNSVAQRLKIQGKSVVVKRGGKGKYVYNQLNFEDYLLNSQDTHDGQVSSHRGVGAVLEAIAVSYNQAVSRDPSRYLKNKKQITVANKIDYSRTFLNTASADFLETKYNKEVFGLKVQQEALKQQLSVIEKHSVNEIAKHEIRLAHDLISEKLEILGFDKNHADKLNNRIKEVKSLIATKAISSSDIKAYTKQLRFLEDQRIRINVGLTTNVMSGIDFKDIDRALGAVGVDLLRIIGDENGRHSFTGDSSGQDYLKKINKLLNTESLVRVIQDHQLILRGGLAVAAQRAGAPSGSFGPVGYLVMSDREFNSHLQKRGISINLDPHMNRRSMFLHLSGMALNLGDYDGDMSTVAQIKRYTYIKTLQAVLKDEGLVALERSSMATVEELRKKGVSEEEIAATRHIKFIGVDKDGNRIGLLQEAQQLENELYRKNGNLLVEQTERFLGLRKGYIATEYAPNEFGVQWRDAEARGDNDAKQLMITRSATKLNMFASDMYSQIWSASQDVVGTYLKQDDKTGISVEDLTMDDLNKLFSTDQAFEKTMRSWYSQASKSMMAKTFGSLFGSEMTVDNVLKYGIKVAFASTKLIGNWTNVQTMQEALNTQNRVASYTELDKIRREVMAVAEATGDQEHVTKMSKEFEDIRTERIKLADEVNQRVNGYLLGLQQATRNAIKEKASLSINKSTSVFQNMLENNPLIRAIDKTYALIYGKSIFEHQLPELSKHGDIYKTLMDIGPDQAIEIMYSSDNKVKATLAQEFLADENLSKVAEHVVLPHLEAMALTHNAINKIEDKLVGMSERERLTFLLSDDGLSEDGRTTALLAAHSLWQSAQDHADIQKYTSALAKKNISHFESARNQMADHLKLVFLHEKLKGGKLDETSLDRVLQDVVDTYVSPYSNIERLQEAASSVDSTGHFANTMTQLVSSYLSGQNISSRFEALKRQDAKHYEVLAEFEYMLADAIPGANPLAEIRADVEGATEANKRFQEDLNISRAIKKAKTVQGSHLETVAHTGIMALLPALGKHAGIIAGAGAGVGLFSTSAHAAQLINGQHEPSTGSPVAKILEYATSSLLMWEPHMALKYLERLNMPFEQQVASQIGFVGAMAAGHFAAVKVSRTAGPRGAAIASLVGMTAAGNVINKLVSEVSRVRQELKTPEHVMATQIVDDINFANLLADELTSGIDGLGEAQERSAVMIDENGDVIPFNQELSEDDVSRGIFDEDTNPIIAEKLGSSTIPDVYAKPEGLGSVTGAMNSEERMNNMINQAKNYRR